MKENTVNTGLEGQSLPQLLEGMHATTLEVHPSDRGSHASNRKGL